MAMTSDERKAKELFVRVELEAMLRRATRGWVRECWYEAHGGGLETVTVVYGDYGTPFDGLKRLHVDVTADSPWAIAKDVMRAVAGVFE